MHSRSARPFALYSSKPHDKEHKKQRFIQRFYTAFNTSFTTLTSKYKKIDLIFIRRKWIPLAALALFAVTFYVISNSLPKSFVPGEDLGVITADISLPALRLPGTH